jgi:hypothetical protein
MKKLTLALSLILLALGISAQNTEFNSALRYSQNIYSGTARFTGLGGAYTALGGDISSISLNPAGLGVYNGSELVFTPSFQFFQANTKTPVNTIDYKKEDFNYNLNFHNIGWVTSFKPTGDSRLTMNIALGYNQLNDYNSKSQANHFNSQQSLMTSFVQNANNVTGFRNDPDALFQSDLTFAHEYLAWQTFQLNYDSTANEWYSNVSDALVLTDTLGVVQRNIKETNGSLGEYFFSFAVNYAHKLYIGTTVGLQRINYEVTTTHRETERNKDILGFESLEFTEYENHSGTGFNVKLGAIYKPTDFLRIGASIHTPTFFNIEYNWKNSMNSNFDIDGPYSAESNSQNFKYRLNTPFRFNSGIALISKKIGLFSVDYEMVNYGFMQLKNHRDNDVQFITENDSIDKTFQVSHNLRLGGELKLDDFYVRLGYAFYQSPYKEEFDYSKSSTQIYSGGFGYRGKSFFIDFAYSRRMWQEKSPIFSTINNLTKSDFTQNKFILTAGLKF